MKKLSAMLPLLWVAIGLVPLSGCWQTPTDRLLGRWQGRAERAADPQSSTVLQQYDFTITLDFIDARSVRLAFGDGNAQARLGTWQVIEAAGDRLTIEISAASTADLPATEIRRFKIHFPPEKDDQFTLVEEGADSQYGAILFRRADAN